MRSLKCGPAETTRASHIDSPHKGQRGRSLTNTIEVKAKSEWGMTLSRLAERLLRRTPRKGNCGLKGVTASLAFPQVAHTAMIDVFRPFRRERLFATLSAFIHRARGSNVGDDAIGINDTGTFLTRLRALYARRFLSPDPNFYLQKTYRNSQAELELITAKAFPES